MDGIECGIYGQWERAVGRRVTAEESYEKTNDSSFRLDGWILSEAAGESRMVD